MQEGFYKPRVHYSIVNIPVSLNSVVDSDVQIHFNGMRQQVSSEEDKREERLGFWHDYLIRNLLKETEQTKMWIYALPLQTKEEPAVIEEFILHKAALIETQ